MADNTFVDKLVDAAYINIEPIKDNGEDTELDHIEEVEQEILWEKKYQEICKIMKDVGDAERKTEQALTLEEELERIRNRYALVEPQYPDDVDEECEEFWTYETRSLKWLMSKKRKKY